MRPAIIPVSIVAATALLLSACHAAAPIALPAAPGMARTGAVRVMPTVKAGDVRELLATKAAYTQASINHMVVELFSVAGATETAITTADLAAADLGKAITFGNLAHDTTYRIRAYAYLTAGTSEKISDDATSEVDVVVTNDDAPVLGNLVVSLVDQTFSGAADTAGLTVNGGAIVHSGAIGFTAFVPTAFTAVATLAGDAAGYADGTGAAAAFDAPADVAFDRAGNLYVADTGNNRIRKVTPAGGVTTFAGSGFSASIDGTGTGAAFSSVSALAIDRDDMLYALDGRCIRKITPAGVVTTLAGDNGQAAGVVDATGGAARFHGPDGIAAAPNGDLWVTDKTAHLVRKVTPAGVVTTVAGSGPIGAAPNARTDGNGASASFAFPSGIAVDRAGNAFVADYGNDVVRKVEPDGDVTTFAGSGAAATTDGAVAAAAFLNPSGLAFDRAGHLLVTQPSVLRRVSPFGAVTTLAGDPAATGATDGTPAAARFNGLLGVASAPDGSACLVDGNNHRLRKLFVDTF